MMRNNNNSPADLRRKTGFETYYRYNRIRISIQDCMVILVVIAILLFSVIAVSATPNPSIIFGV